MVWLLFALLFIFISPPVQAATPEGWVDTVEYLPYKQLRISGWARDPDHPDQPISVHFYIGGPSGMGAHIGSITANKNRSDVGAHGFSVDIALDNKYQHGYHGVFAHGIDLDKEENSLLSPQLGKTFYTGTPDPLIQHFQQLPCTPTNQADLTISNQINNNLKIQINTTAKMAGAIASLKINDLETVDVFDHGRELQYAYQIDGQGEKNNPTEAGNSGDKDTSSSIFLGGCSTDNTLYTKTQMAYWRIRNGQKTSPYVMEKIVQIGIPGHPNVIKFLGKFTMAEDVKGLSIEVPTGYHIYDFGHLTLMKTTDFSTYIPDPESFRVVVPFDRVLHTKNLIILSNGTYSFAVYSPYPVRYSFLHSQSASTTKWTMGRMFSNLSAGTDIYVESYMIIDTPQQIQNSLINLVNALNSSITLGDINGDNKVDLTDYSLWKEQFILGELGTKTLSSPADFNQDNKVNILDYSIWKQAYINSFK